MNPLVCIDLYFLVSQVAPMSIYACLGSDAAAIRDAFLTRLQSKTEDMRIKVMILEFLTVAVETQPGLIELFLNLEAKDGSEGSKVSEPSWGSDGSSSSQTLHLFPFLIGARSSCWASGAACTWCWS